MKTNQLHPQDFGKDVAFLDSVANAAVLVFILVLIVIKFA